MRYGSREGWVGRVVGRPRLADWLRHQSATWSWPGEQTHSVSGPSGYLGVGARRVGRLSSAWGATEIKHGGDGDQTRGLDQRQGTNSIGLPRVSSLAFGANQEWNFLTPTN